MNANSNLFTAAHKIARETRSAFDSYKAAFSAALKQLWNEVKEEAQKAIEEAARFASKIRAKAQARIEKAAQWAFNQITAEPWSRSNILKKLDLLLITRPLNASDREEAIKTTLKMLGLPPAF